MSLLAIDLWDKKCGIALEIGGICLPYDVVARTKLVDYLKKIVIEKGIIWIIVGLPYDLYGKDEKQLDKTKKFIGKLKDFFPKLQIDTIDERYSSFEAKNTTFAGEKDIIDDVSASIILESYIEKNTP